MDYEKKYEEALERAKAGKPMDEVFPELKESEDERIRKELLAVINDLVLPDEQKARFNAYLEKQKEQKPVEYLNKDKAYAIMTKLTNLSYSKLIPINSDEYKKLHEITSDVRDLLDYPIEQKPAEWSEEDEAIACKLEYILRVNYVSPYIIKWALEHLRPQPKQEWSEEDKVMLGKVFECIRFAEDRYQLEEEQTNGVSIKSWLLVHINHQPHWKPSKAQINALKVVARGFPADDLDAIDSLLTDLQKLL